MPLRLTRLWAVVFTATAFLSVPHIAQAQLFGRFGLNACDPCRASAFAPNYQMTAYAPQVNYNACSACTTAYVQPQPQRVVYQTVPETTYEQVTQTVRKPVYETAYKDVEVTEYRTVYETVNHQVPTVSYQNVTDYQTITRDMGRWQTYRQPVAKCSPCSYDPSPTLLGWMNRTAYSMRNAMTPNYRTHRQYVPNVVAQQVPVTRTVAVRGTQQVQQKVAKIVPFTTTKKVAYNTVRWEEKQVVAMKPVTNYKTVAVGTQTAYGFVPFSKNGSGTTTASNPTPDPVSAKKTDSTDVKKTAKEENKFDPFGSGQNTRPAQPSSHPSPVSPQDLATQPEVALTDGWRTRSSSLVVESNGSGPLLVDPVLQIAVSSPR